MTFFNFLQKPFQHGKISFVGASFYFLFASHTFPRGQRCSRCTFTKLCDLSEMKNMCSSAKTVITNGLKRCRAASVEWFNFSLLVFFFCRLLWPILPRGRSLVHHNFEPRWAVDDLMILTNNPPPTWQVSYQEAPHRFFRDCTVGWWWGCIFAIHYLVRHRYFNIYHFIISHFPRIMQPPLAIGNAICLCASAVIVAAENLLPSIH